MQNNKKDLKNMDVATLQLIAHEIRKEAFLFRMKQVSEPDKNTAKPKNLRKHLAYVLTLIRQKELQ